MTLIRTINNQPTTSAQEALYNKANDVIGIGEFGGDLFISFYNIPLYPIAETSTAKEILSKLKEFRQSYLQAISSKC